MAKVKYYIQYSVSLENPLPVYKSKSFVSILSVQLRLQILPWDFYRQRRQEDEDQSSFDLDTERIRLQILPWDFYRQRRQEDEGVVG